MQTTVFVILMFAARIASAQTPLDLLDPTPRLVFVQLETSSDLAEVGQSFGTLVTANYSASGNTGTLLISSSAHEQLRAGFLQPVPGTFTQIAIQFDLTTFAATSQPATGALAGGQISESFTQNELGTGAVAGFMGPDVPPLFCTSQADVDFACGFLPEFCGQTCTIVAGETYDQVTGLVNLVGSETATGCDGALCSGPFTYFSGRGDLMVSEVAAAGALPSRPRAVIPAALIVCACAACALYRLKSAAH